MEMISVKNLSKIYGKGDNSIIALNNVSLEIEAGERVSIIGRSGSGKSTLLHMLGGVDVPTSGSVIVDGEDISKYKDEELSIFRRRKVGFVFQSYHLVSTLSVYENIIMPVLMDYGKPDKDYIENIIEMLGLKDKMNSMPGQLSGGQQQRVSIARAMANRPAVILADEPTGSLDTANGEAVIEILNASVRKLQQTLLLITHNVDIANQMDRVLKLNDGKLSE